MVMSLFGVDFETGRHVIADEVEIPIEPGDVVYFSGESGSGKSSLLRGVADRLDGVVDIAALDVGERCLIDALDVPVADAMRWLSLCGLSEAQLLLRTPAELSDGQRFRFRLALGLSRRPRWLLADEFTAALDRPLAKVIAFNLRKLATREGFGCLLASTHDDILDDLQPDLLVRCDLGSGIDAARRGVQKKVSASPTSCGSPRVPDATGRTSRGGITATITSGSCGS